MDTTTLETFTYGGRLARMAIFSQSFQRCVDDHDTAATASQPATAADTDTKLARQRYKDPVELVFSSNRLPKMQFAIGHQGLQTHDESAKLVLAVTPSEEVAAAEAAEAATASQSAHCFQAVLEIDHLSALSLMFLKCGTRCVPGSRNLKTGSYLA